jgi:hypothetical protein
LSVVLIWMYLNRLKLDLDHIFYAKICPAFWQKDNWILWSSLDKKVSPWEKYIYNFSSIKK